MRTIQIGETETGRKYKYIGLDFEAKRVYLLVGYSIAKATPFLLRPESELFHKLAPGWQNYCWKAWEEMRKR